MNYTDEYNVESIKKIAKENFNVEHLFPIQLFIIYNLLHKKPSPAHTLATKHNTENTSLPEDIDDALYYKKYQIIILPTGMGKTLCFQIPALLSKKPTLVIYPLLSLIHDQFHRFHNAIPTKVLVGGMPYAQTEEILEQTQKGTIKCILSNPETILAYKKKLQNIQFSSIILDEAHCISKWGLSFRPSYANIGNMLSHMNFEYIAAFTATASHTVIEDITRLAFHNERPYIVNEDANRKNISYSALHCIHKDRALLSLLSTPKHKKNSTEKDNTHTYSDSSHSTSQAQEVPAYLPCQSNFSTIERPAIIFCNNRKECRRLALLLHDTLQDNEIYFYHAGLSKEEKKNIEQWFFTSENGVLVSTCAYGMGVDKSNIRTVIHVDNFTDIESYLQESGRAGRDRNPAKAIQLCTVNDISYTILNTSMTARSNKDIATTLQKKTHSLFEQYLLATACRRTFLIEALQSECSFCEGCDSCKGNNCTVSPELLLLLQCIETYAGMYSAHYFTHNNLNHIFSEPQHTSNTLLSLVMHMFSTWTTPQIQTCISNLQTLNIIKKGKFLWKDRLFLTKKGKQFLRLLKAYNEKKNY